MTFKEEIHAHSRQIVVGKIDTLLQKQQDLLESMAGETKSSAGDKYETSRAMLHIEREQLNRQISELRAQLAILNSLDPTVKAQLISLGSLALVGETYYYLSTGLGKMTVADRLVIALSPQSPLGAKMKGLAVGSSLEINKREMVIGWIM
jgi:hypothetical protein